MPVTTSSRPISSTTRSAGRWRPSGKPASSRFRGSARNRATSIPNEIKKALEARDHAGGDDSCVERAGDRPADRGHRRDRPRGRRSAPGRRGPDGGRGADRSSRHADRHAGVSRAINHSTVRPVRARSMSAPEPTAGSGPGARGEPEATRPARLSPLSFPTCSRAEHRTSWELPGLAAGVAWVAEHGPENLRQKEVALLERVVDWARIPDGCASGGALGQLHRMSVPCRLSPPTRFRRRTSPRSSTRASISPSGPDCTARLIFIAPWGLFPTARSG